MTHEFRVATDLFIETLPRLHTSIKNKCKQIRYTWVMKIKRVGNEMECLRMSGGHVALSVSPNMQEWVDLSLSLATTVSEVCLWVCCRDVTVLPTRWSEFLYTQSKGTEKKERNPDRVNLYSWQTCDSWRKRKRDLCGWRKARRFEGKLNWGKFHLWALDHMIKVGLWEQHWLFFIGKIWPFSSYDRFHEGINSEINEPNLTWPCSQVNT